VLNEGAAFLLLGHSCGGIQQKVYPTGFGPAPGGYPEGDATLSTRCGGSGRDGGGHVTEYKGAASVVWNWFGQTRSYVRLETPVGAGGEMTDSFGDRIYNVGTSAYLETGAPPLQSPAPPSGIQVGLESIETAEEQPPTLRFRVSWTADPINAGVITSSTVTATPTGGSSAPTLATTVTGAGTSAILQPLERHTTYLITVTSADAEGTSEPSQPFEANSETGGGPPPPPPPVALATCETDQGTIKLSPGLTETPHVQNITIKGTLGECDGSAGVESATYVDDLTTTEEVTCSALQSYSTEPTTVPVSLSFKWVPHELGTSHGTLVVPITEASTVALEGALEGGPFSAPEPITAGAIYESFTGGATCGVAQGHKKAKAVKSGTFSGTAVEIGEAK
jgi:hypothetical protein